MLVIILTKPSPVSHTGLLCCTKALTFWMRATLLCKDLVTPFSYSFLLMWLTPVSPFRLDWYLKRDFSIVSKGSTESRENIIQKSHYTGPIKTAASLIRYCYFWAVSKVWLLPLQQLLWGVKFLLLSVGWYLTKSFSEG